MARYGKAASRSVETEMRHKMTGKHKIKSRKQAIAIGLSEAREKGAKVPSKSSGPKTAGRKKAGRKKSTSAKKR